MRSKMANVRTWLAVSVYLVIALVFIALTCALARMRANAEFQI